MKKVAKKTIKKSDESPNRRFDRIETLIDNLAQMTMSGFQRIETRIETIEKTKSDKADILDLHDKFIHRREFDELSLRVSKIEAKIRQ